MLNSGLIFSRLNRLAALYFAMFSCAVDSTAASEWSMLNQGCAKACCAVSLSAGLIATNFETRSRACGLSGSQCLSSNFTTPSLFFRSTS